jgi:hypothetical protein
VKEQEQNITPEKAATELAVIPTSIRIQEKEGKFSGMSMAIEYEGLPHMVIVWKPGYSDLFVHAPYPPHDFQPLFSTEGLDTTTAEKILEMLDVETKTEDPVEMVHLLQQESSKRDADYKRIRDEYMKNPEKREAYGDAVRAFAEDLKNMWERKNIPRRK